MAADKAVDKPPKGKGILKLDIKPADVVITVDDKPAGRGGKLHSVALNPGQHIVKLVRKGLSHEEPISLKAGETKTWAFDLGSSDPKDEVKLDPPSGEPTPTPTPE